MLKYFLLYRLDLHVKVCCMNLTESTQLSQQPLGAILLL